MEDIAKDHNLRIKTLLIYMLCIIPDLCHWEMLLCMFDKDRVGERVRFKGTVPPK